MARTGTIIPIDKLRYLYLEKKKSSWEIAKIFGCSQRWIITLLERSGIPRRSYKENKMPIAKGSHLQAAHRKAISKGLKSSKKFKEWRSAKVGENHPNWTPLIEKICDYCRQSFKRKPFHFRDSKKVFCGWDCQRKYNHENAPGKNPPITTKCDWCGLELKIWPSKQKRNKQNFCSRKCQGLWRAEYQRGEKIYNWKGGYKPYYGENWLVQRRKARKQDSDTCQNCGRTKNELGKEIPVHHIISFSQFGLKNYKEANKLSNLICLCPPCHSKVTNGVIAIET